MRFGEVLLKSGYINDHQLDLALKEQEYNLKTIGYSEPIGSIMLRNGIIDEETHEKALIDYFRILSEDEEEPSYVRETAKIAYRAMQKETGEGQLSEETKMIILQKISEYEEKITQFEKSIATLSKMEQKRVIVDTIAKEKREIEKLINRIEILRKDLEIFT